MSTALRTTMAAGVRLIPGLVVLLFLASCAAQRLEPKPSPQSANTNTAVQSPLPPPSGLVNDFANVLDSDSKQRLELFLKELDEKSDLEFSVVTVETTGDQSIFDYSLAVAKGWGVGSKDRAKAGGLLLLLAIKDRTWRIQVSRELEKDLPNDVCKELGDKSIDFYRKGKWAQGISLYVKEIVDRLEKHKGFSLNRDL
jgi:uncharacterized protein